MRADLCGDRQLKTFLIELSMAWAAQKNNVTLKPDWKLPKMRYKGSKIAAQTLKLDRKPVSTGSFMHIPVVKHDRHN